jgi:Ulp1 family protease
MLNDEIINLWRQHLIISSKGLVEAGAVVGHDFTARNGASTVMLSTFFFSALSKNWQARRAFAYERARLWAKDVLRTKFRGVTRLLVPVHIPHRIHWVLAVVHLTSDRVLAQDGSGEMHVSLPCPRPLPWGECC